MASPADETRTLDVLDAIALRRSIREFRPDPVPEPILMTLLDAAHQAASSWNLQPWEFIIVTDEEAKKALSEAVTPGNLPVVLTGGATFVCLGSMRQQDALVRRLEQMWLTPDAPPDRVERAQRNLKRLRDDEQWRREHVLTNTYIGITQLVLAAQKFGLGTLWMGGFDADKVKAVLGIPADYLVASLVTVGWPVQALAPQARKRRPLEETYWRNRFGAK